MRYFMRSLHHAIDHVMKAGLRVHVSLKNMYSHGRRYDLWDIETHHCDNDSCTCLFVYKHNILCFGLVFKVSMHQCGTVTVC